MFRRLNAYILVALYLVAMLKPVAPFIDYALNYDYISEVLCINKDKPEISCNGKCYVMKQLEEQKTNDLKSLQVVIKDYPIGFVEILTLEKPIKVVYLNISKKYFHQSVYTFDLMEPEYHPPENA